MTYIVDQKVVAGTDILDTSKGQPIMGVAEHIRGIDHAQFARIIGPDMLGHSLKVDSQEITYWLQRIVSELVVMKYYLGIGADEQIDPSDLEDL